MANDTSKTQADDFGVLDFLWRWLAALALVLLTYNPTGYSYVHWVREGLAGDGIDAIHFFVGVLIVAGWTVLVAATRRSLGLIGTIIGALLVGTAIWVLVDVGLIDATARDVLLWLGLIAVATVLGLGLSWSHIWRRLSGQLEVDDD